MNDDAVALLTVIEPHAFGVELKEPSEKLNLTALESPRSTVALCPAALKSILPPNELWPPLGIETRVPAAANGALPYHDELNVGEAGLGVGTEMPVAADGVEVGIGLGVGVGEAAFGNWTT
jgi:hypothetical protein